MGALEAGERLIACVAPRGHAKSTCAALAYPLWCVCEGRRRNIVIVTHEGSLARQFVRDIRTELETNELLHARYGDLTRPPPGADKPRGPRARWRDDVFTTATGITVQAKGTGQSLRGTRVGPQRPDLIICDDIEKDVHVATPQGRQRTEYWLRRVVMPALAPGGQIVVVGSIIHYESLLAKLRDRRQWPRWHYRVYRAIECALGADGLYRRVALWPARWPLAALDEEAERIGTIAFEQEYMANPINTDLRLFDPEWLQRYDPAELEGRELIHLMAVDPSTGTPGGDFFAVWVGSVDVGSGVIYTRELTLQRIHFNDQLRCVIDMAQRWRPMRIAVETAGYQGVLMQALEDESRRRGLYLPLVGVATRVNKSARIASLAPLFEQGLLRLPPVVDGEVLRQFVQFPASSHDDAPDAVALGVDLVRSLRAGMRVEGMTGGGRGWA